MSDALFTNSSSVVASRRILYTPSSFAKSSLFHLQEIGTLKALHEHSSARKDMDSYLFFMVLSGSGELIYGKRAYKLQAGDCVFIDCKEDYVHRTANEDLWSLSWCHFYGPNMQAVYSKYKERGGTPVFTPKDFDSYCKILKNLYDIAESEDYIRDMRLHEKISSLLVYLMEDAWETREGHPEGCEPGRKSAVRDIQEIKDYLDRNFKKKITLDELADRFFINKFYMSELFKSRYGITIGAYLMQTRVTYVKQQLRFTDRSLEAIAEDLGMEITYLSRMFKNVEGVSPSLYRKQWKGRFGSSK